MKSIAKVWTFKSSSSERTYQTLLYTNFTTSCDCPGWTRRTDSNGKRTCRHTRSVQLGNADAEAINFHVYHYSPTGKGVCSLTRPTQPLNVSTSQPSFAYGQRKLCI
jgi:hypothetical protein